MAEKTYTGDQVKEMLGASMDKFRGAMIDLIREAARHRRYRDLNGKEALEMVADKLAELQNKIPC